MWSLLGSFDISAVSLRNLKIILNYKLTKKKTVKSHEEPEHEKYDMVEVRTQTREDGRIYRAVGTVKRVDPDRPHYVRLHGYKNYRRVLQNFTRQWTLMISNDTQSSAEDSISQSY